MTNETAEEYAAKHIPRLTRLYLPQRYWRWLRFQAGERDMPLTKLLSDIVADYVADHGEYPKGTPDSEGFLPRGTFAGREEKA